MIVFEPDLIDGGCERQGSQVLAERRLMAAILADALDCYQKHMFTSNVRRRRLFREAERWILSEDHWVFSFRNICDTLRIDADAVRQQARVWRRHQLRGIVPDALPVARAVNQ